MPETQALSNVQATDMLVTQFSQPSSTFDAVVAELGSLEEAVCAMTTALAPVLCADAPKPADLTRRLAEWHSTVREDCSDLFGAYRHEDPSASREALNARSDLQILNGIRRGIHRAMVESEARPNSPPRYGSVFFTSL